MTVDTISARRDEGRDVGRDKGRERVVAKFNVVRQALQLSEKVANGYRIWMNISDNIYCEVQNVIYMKTRI